MSKEAFIKFYNEYVPSHPELQKQVDNLHNEDQFAKIALEHGPKNGFNFTKEEMGEVMSASKAKMLGQSELNDSQLEGVTGGAIATQTPTQTVQIRSIAISPTGGIKVPDLGATGTDMCCW
jgi:predicted ribosomally synthesized peptide with nif11-like leader